MPFFFIIILSICSSLSFAAGSNQVRPPENLQLQYPTHITPTAQIENEQYPTNNCPPIPVCDVKNPNPDNCPNQCKVDRITTPDYGSAEDPQYPYVYKVQNAVCPPGYAQVASFKMQKEIIHDPSRTPIPKVLYSEVKTYDQLGYTCFPTDPILRKNICSSDVHNPPFETKVLVNIDGYAAQFSSAIKGPCHPALSDCKYGNQPCSWLGSVRTWYGDYKIYSCTPPTNQLYYGIKRLPTSIVCAHVRPGWQAVPQPTNP